MSEDEPKLVKHTISSGTIKAKEKQNPEAAVKELQDTIMALPHNIKALRTQRIEIDHEILSTQRSMGRMKAQIQSEINSETGADGKEIFGSDTKRKTELTTRMSKDEVALNLQTEIDTLKQNAKGIEIDLEFAQNRFKAARKVADIITGTRD